MEQPPPGPRNPDNVNKETRTTEAVDGATKAPLTVSAWGERWIEMRDAAGHRSTVTDRRRWRTHVDRNPLGAKLLTSVTRADAWEWLHQVVTSKNAQPYRRGPRNRIAVQTAKNALVLVRCAFEDALHAGIVLENPFRMLRIPRSRGATTKERSTTLRPHEQLRLLEVIPEPDRWLVAFAMGSGIRQAEQWSLRRSDLHIGGERKGEPCDPYITVRYGTIDDKPTKSGQPRIVPLFGISLLAIRKWLANGWKPNRMQLLFPRASGYRRDHKPPKDWHEWVKKAGIRRRVRWHDLRHTCGASLVSGWWGRRWSLEEVKELLGHSSIQVTERYARFADDVLTRAADESDPERRAREIQSAASVATWIATESVEPGIGVEPTTAALRKRCSATELPRPSQPKTSSH